MTGALALVGTPAQAHDALIGSDPADGSVLVDTPTSVVLTFANPQTEIGAEVVVTGPDGAAWSDGAAVVSGATLTQPLREGLPNGSYLVQWRSVAADGHPVSGTLAFSLERPIEPTAAPVTTAPVLASEAAPTPTETPSLTDSAEDPADEVPSRLPLLVGAVLLAVVVGYLLFWASRRRSA